ncbi:MAG TPA: ABC transporter ATP-binding protein [Bryobacteraceae bacterium]|nr:ABC transporter ATP-binding protein [Bryobacteraceae bacterium]
MMKPVVSSDYNPTYAGPLLSVKVSAAYGGRAAVLRAAAFDVNAGEIVGLAGQSGSGKSTIALAIMRLLYLKGGVAEGHILFRGRDLLRRPEREMRDIRGREIAMVLQNPVSSLNPALRLGTQMSEAWEAHRHTSSDARETVMLETLRAVSLDVDRAFLRRFPGELSVGQAQRVLIAMAILHRPALLIADEATSALDALTQSEILRLFERLNRELAMAILYISHDLLSIASLCGRVAVLHQGEIVEFGPTARVFQAPVHAYTRQLVEAIPTVEFASAVG